MAGHLFRYVLLCFVAALVLPNGDLQASSLGQRGQINADLPMARSITVPARSQLWVDGVIPYTIDASLQPSSQRAVARAIDHWNKVGGVSLLPLAQVQSRTEVDIKDSVRFVIGEYCASWVGRQGGEQNLWVALNCPTGSIMHEIGHLLGLEHEHTRPDRDAYIKIHWDNIELDKRHNFETAPAGSSLSGSYDVDSIMHYGSHNFSRNGEPTMTLLDGSVGGIGQRIAPSPGDLEAVSRLYASDLSVVARTAAAGAGTELDIYVSNQTLQGAHDIELQVAIGESGGPVTPLSDQWDCANTEGKIICLSSILAGGAVSHLNMALPDAANLSEIDVQLMSKTFDTDPSNNNSQVSNDELKEPPARQPAPEPLAVLSNDTMVQEDAVAHVSMSAGALSLGWVAGLLLLLVRQTGIRVKRQPIVVVHGG